MSQLNFDANQVKPAEAFEPLPKGWYNMRISESETKPTKAEGGAYLQLTVEVIDGQYANRKVFDRLNLWNANPVASEIAQRRLSAYCHATGVMMLQDSQRLHGIPFKGRISIREDKTGAYEPSNEIKDIKHINDQVQQAPSPGFTPPTQPAQPGPTSFGAPPQQTPWNAPPQTSPAQQAPAFVPPQQAPAFTPPQQQAFTPPPPQQAPQAGPTPPWARK